MIISYSLFFLRLTLGFILLADSLDGETNLWFVVGLAAALLSDYFDGVIARQLGVATEQLRVLDSRVDAIFMFSVAASLWFAHQDVVREFMAPIGWMFGVYFLSLLIPWLKFRQMPAYHAYSAKLAGLLMFLAVMALFGFGRVDWLLWAAMIMAILSHLDRIFIALILPAPQTDVPGIWEALRIRNQG